MIAQRHILFFVQNNEEFFVSFLYLQYTIFVAVCQGRGL